MLILIASMMMDDVSCDGEGNHSDDVLVCTAPPCLQDDDDINIEELRRYARLASLCYGRGEEKCQKGLLPHDSHDQVHDIVMGDSKVDAKKLLQRNKVSVLAICHLQLSNN